MMLRDGAIKSISKLRRITPNARTGVARHSDEAFSAAAGASIVFTSRVVDRARDGLRKFDTEVRQIGMDIT